MRLPERILQPIRGIYCWLFSYFHFAIRLIRKDTSIRNLVDIGCGRGLPVKALKLYKVSIDINLFSLNDCVKRKTHNAVICCDAKHLPLRDKSFNTALCLQVLHLLRKRGSLKA